jgi:hypothetical protein
VSSLSNQRPEAGPRTHADMGLPTAARSLLRKLDGWKTFTRPAAGQLEFGSLSVDTDGNGKRHRISLVENVDSVLIRARHTDGRALVAVWIRRESRKGWTLDMAWRGRRADEYAPRQVTARELAAYVADQALEAVAA